MWRTNQESPRTLERIHQHCLDCGLCISHSKVSTKLHYALDLADHAYCICMPVVDDPMARPVSFVKEAKRIFTKMIPTTLRRPVLEREGSIQEIPPRRQSTTQAINPFLALSSHLNAEQISASGIHDRSGSNADVGN